VAVTGDELDAIEKRAAAATPGPWVWPMPGSANLQNIGAVLPRRRACRAVAASRLAFKCSAQMEADAAFIAGARGDVPALTAEVRRLRAALAAERERCARVAEALGAAVETGPGGDCVQGCRGIAQEIAAAIREGRGP
jgi:hypothetical protein